MKKILIVVCTHGDELAPLQLFLRHPYGRSEKVEWEVMVANWKAAFQHTRYINDNLNRLFAPGYKLSEDSWEAGLVPILKQRIQTKKYDVLYDVHTTTRIKSKENPDCAFVNRWDSATKKAVQYVASQFVIHDNNPKYNKQYVTSVHPVGITLEYQKTVSFEDDVARIMADFHSITHEQAQRKKVLFEADRPVTQKDASKYKLKFTDFLPLTALQKKYLGLPKHETYVPVFVNPPDTDPDYYCFLNRKVE